MTLLIIWYIQFGLIFNSFYLLFFRVECKCGSCGTRKLHLSEWERHTGKEKVEGQHQSQAFIDHAGGIGLYYFIFL